jgi:hypothetical protein
MDHIRSRSLRSTRSSLHARPIDRSIYGLKICRCSELLRRGQAHGGDADHGLPPRSQPRGSSSSCTACVDMHPCGCQLHALFVQLIDQLLARSCVRAGEDRPDLQHVRAADVHRRRPGRQQLRRAGESFLWASGSGQALHSRRRTQRADYYSTAGAEKGSLDGVRRRQADEELPVRVRPGNANAISHTTRSRATN